MSIATSVRTAGPFVGNGVTQSFPFAFKVFATSDVILQQTDTVGNITTPVGYSVSLNADQDNNPGGSVTLAAPLTNLYQLNMTSGVTATQPATLTNAGGFFAKTIEYALDRLTILLQQFGSVNFGQNLRVPEIAGIPVLPSAGVRASTMFVWDALGNPSFIGIPVGGLVTNIISDTGAYSEQPLTSAGVVKFAQRDQTAARKAEYLYWGTASAPLYGMTAGYAGINTAAGVGFTIGVGDAVKMTIDPTTGLAGFGLAPSAGLGQIQLLGSANGGIRLGNVNNAASTALDWYEEGIWTPVLKFGASSTGITYGTQLGTFTRIGNSVRCRMRLILTNKGSASGSASIAGMPYAPLGVGDIPSVIFGDFNNMVALGANFCFGLSGNPGGLTLNVVVVSLASSSPPFSAADTSFTGAAYIDVNFEYRAA